MYGAVSTASKQQQFFYPIINFSNRIKHSLQQFQLELDLHQLQLMVQFTLDVQQFWTQETGYFTQLQQYPGQLVARLDVFYRMFHLLH